MKFHDESAEKLEKLKHIQNLIRLYYQHNPESADTWWDTVNPHLDFLFMDGAPMTPRDIVDNGGIDQLFIFVKNALQD